MYITRTLEPFIQKANQQFPVLLLVGPRQVGKTTLLRHLSQDERDYVTLDDPNARLLAKEDPGLFLQRYTPPLMIDEIQYAPELFSHIKMQVDQTQKPGMFWLTGSQQFHLMNNVSESLAGRVGIINLLGLSLGELLQRQKQEPFLPTNDFLQERLKHFSHLPLQDVYHIIWRGTYPAMWRQVEGEPSDNVLKNTSTDRDLFYRSYVQTYLQRDVNELANIGDGSSFFKFLRAAAARTGQLLNISEMARAAAITVPTAKKWLGVLEASGMIYLLEPYFSNTTKRLVKAPKLYFLDTGLCAYLTEWSDPKTLEAGAMSGAILETFVFAEILKSYWNNGKRAPLYFYRDKDKREIDLLIVQNDTLYPLEIKKTAQPDRNAIKHFQVLENLGKPIGDGGIICFINTLMPIKKNIHAIPIGML